MQIASSTYYARKKMGPISAAMLAEAYDAHAVHPEFVRLRGVHGVRKCGMRCGAPVNRPGSDGDLVQATSASEATCSQ